MPPGTGDIQLTLSQRVPVSGAVIVTTLRHRAARRPQGTQDVREGRVPVLGVVENMSTHICSKCGHEEHIFGSGGGARMAEQYHVELLGVLPLDIRIREQADGGRPTVVAEPTARARGAIAKWPGARLRASPRRRATPARCFRRSRLRIAEHFFQDYADILFVHEQCGLVERLLFL